MKYLNQPIFPLMVFSMLALIPMRSLAADSSWLPGECRPINGTHLFPFNFLKQINDLKDNDIDQIYPDAYTWNNNTNYEVGCNCSEGSSWQYTFYKAESNLNQYKTDGTRTFYKVTDNIAVASQVYIWGLGFLNVPFISANQGNTSNAHCTSVNAVSGSQGKIDLLIIRPFIGTVNIPSTNLVNVYGSVINNSFGSIPLAKVVMSGSVTVQQSCEINAGNSIQIDFGDMFNGNFKGPGTKPEGITSKTLQLGYKCNLISKGMDVNMRFTGQSDSNYPVAFSTSNPDIGVVIEDGNGNRLQPNTGKLPMTVDYDTQTGSVNIITYPVSTTGNIPNVGQFTSRATVVVDFQ